MARPSGCVRLGAGLKAARLARGFSQDEIAYRLQVDRSRIAQWEGAHRAIKPREMFNLKTALSIRLEGVNWRARSTHHGEVCRADFGEGAFAILDAKTGAAIFPAGAEA